MSFILLVVEGTAEVLVRYALDWEGPWTAGAFLAGVLYALVVRRYVGDRRTVYPGILLSLVCSYAISYFFYSVINFDHTETGPQVLAATLLLGALCTTSFIVGMLLVLSVYALTRMREKV